MTGFDACLILNAIIIGGLGATGNLEPMMLVPMGMILLVAFRLWG